MRSRITKKKVWIGLSLLIISLAVPVTLLLLKRNTDTRTSADTETASVFFLPETATLPPEQIVRLMIDSKQIPVGFVQIDITFDNTKVKIKNQPTFNDYLKTIIRKPSMADINSTGKISLAMGLSPEDINNAPQGVFEVAGFTIEASSTENASAMFQFADIQIVKSKEPVELIVNSTPLTVTLNPNSPTGTNEENNGGTTETETGETVNTNGSSRYKFGDINEDGVVNILDYSILFDNFGKQMAAGHQFKKADINDDGTVNVLDYSVLFDNFGKQIE